MAESLVVTVQLPVYPERVYRAWLSAGELSKISGGAAHVDARSGGEFTALDGRVQGHFETLTPYDRVVMCWQMREFAGPEMQVELRLEPTCTGSELTIQQNGIPAGKTSALIAWWDTNFLLPLKAYFEELVGEYPADMGDG